MLEHDMSKGEEYLRVDEHLISFSLADEGTKVSIHPFAHYVFLLSITAGRLWLLLKLPWTVL